MSGAARCLGVRRAGQQCAGGATHVALECQQLALDLRHWKGIGRKVRGIWVGGGGRGEGERSVRR